jgi:hypothetical protein
MTGPLPGQAAGGYVLLFARLWRRAPQGAFGWLRRADAADAYAGFNRFYEAGRKPPPVIEAACWAHARPLGAHSHTLLARNLVLDQPSSTRSIRRPGSPTCWAACRSSR